MESHPSVAFAVKLDIKWCLMGSKGKSRGLILRLTSGVGDGRVVSEGELVAGDQTVIIGQRRRIPNGETNRIAVVASLTRILERSVKVHLFSRIIRVNIDIVSDGKYKLLTGIL